MKKTICLLSLLCLSISMFAQGGAEMCSRRKSNMSLAKLGSLLSPNSPQHKFDVLNYKLNLNLFSNFSGSYPKSFAATEVITLRVDTSLTQLSLDAVNSSLTVNSVGMAGQSFSHSGDILNIVLNQQYNPGDTISIAITYIHKNVNDNHFFVDNGFVYTDCEPEGARCWFPCWDKPSDKATTDITAKVPVNVKLASNGRLADSIINGDTVTYHWISRDPMATYLVVITAKVSYMLDIIYWQNLSNPNVYTPVRFYYNNGETPAPIEFMMPLVMTYFSTIFCEYPFEKNGYATLDPNFSWGGMENQTITSLCPGCWNESTVVHEFAHQWFGDMITCGTWADITLNEGFATYCEALWYEHEYNYTTYKQQIQVNANKYFNTNPGWAIYNPDWAVNTPSTNAMFNTAITYYKGSCVLSMLRYVMGDSLFFQGLKDYCTDTVNFKYKNAVLQDFNARMNQTYGQSLDWFFNEWYKFPNNPTYQNSYNIVDMGAGTWKLSFFAKQVQTGATFFKMPLDLQISFVSGNDTMIRVMNDVNDQVFYFYFQKQPTHLVFDPQNDIVLKEGGTTVNIEDPAFTPNEYLLSQNIPNPANETTMIQYELPQRSDVDIKLMDITGKEVKILEHRTKNAGIYQIHLNTNELQSGIYLYTIKAGSYFCSRKMMVY
ncbi:MAG: M1 family aminopeptidase [Bacteroidota bacterium]